MNGAGNSLKLHQITKRFGNTTAVNGVSVEILPSTVVALTGGNGSGKSTLLKVVYGALRPDAGSVFFGETKLGDGNPERCRNAGIELVFQDSGHCPSASVLENLYLGREVRGPFGFVNLRRMRSEVMRLFEQVGLPLPNLDVKVQALSGGQQKAVAIYRALLSRPHLVLLDEATANLGVREQEMVMNAFTSLKDQGIAFVFCTHSPDEVLAFADRILVMRRGEIREDRLVRGLGRSELAVMMSG